MCILKENLKLEMPICYQCIVLCFDLYCRLTGAISGIAALLQLSSKSIDESLLDLVHSIEDVGEKEKARNQNADTDSKHPWASLKCKEGAFGAELLQGDHESGRDYAELYMDTSGTTCLLRESLAFYGTRSRIYGTIGHHIPHGMPFKLQKKASALANPTQEDGIRQRPRCLSN